MLRLGKNLLVAEAIVALFALIHAPEAGAQPTTGVPSSILFFPKIVADSTGDSLIQLNNSSNSIVAARCFYISSDLLEIDFRLFLSGAQSTHWTASEGRLVDPDDDCLIDGELVGDCSGAGLDPGLIPPLPADFRGQLLCVQTDISGIPIGGNNLFGTVTFLQRNSASVSKYQAIGLKGSELAGTTGNSLPLEGGPAGQYAACPESWVLSHGTDTDEGPERRRTCLTVASCSFDLETQTANTATVELSATNELGDTFSTFTRFDLWQEICPADLSPFFAARSSGANQVLTRVRPAPNSPGVVVIAETTHTLKVDGSSSISATNPQSVGALEVADEIVLPDLPRSGGGRSR